MAKETPPPARSFSLHWGKGVIEEEVRVDSTYHQPTIQLLKFTEGAAAGTREIRFCYYDHRGRFQRSPLIIDGAQIGAAPGTVAREAGGLTTGVHAMPAKK
jgi:hypothetical protein